MVVIIRSLIAFFSLLIFTRALGKQAISELTFFDYVLGITIGSIAASLSVDLSSRAWPHWIGLLTWTITVFILDLITIRIRSVSNYLLGQPQIVIMNGQILESNMKKSRYTLADLLEQLRNKDVFDLNKVAYAILETNGNLSVLLKSQYQPATPFDLQIPTQPAALDTEIIFNGLVLEDSLKKLKLDHNWLSQYLQSQGLDSPSQVFMLTADSQGNFYCDKYQDHIKNQ